MPDAVTLLTPTQPAVLQSKFVYDSLPHRLTMQFNVDVSADLTASDLTLINLSAGQILPTSDFPLTFDSATNTATFTYTGQLPDANYLAILPATSVTDQGGPPLANDVVFGFFFYGGDANHDRSVNALDFNVIATNYGKTNATFADGDFNYDGSVNTLDFTLMAARFGSKLQPVQFDNAPTISGDSLANVIARLAPSSNLFSDESIQDKIDALLAGEA